MSFERYIFERQHLSNQNLSNTKCANTQSSAQSRQYRQCTIQKEKLSAIIETLHHGKLGSTSVHHPHFTSQIPQMHAHEAFPDFYLLENDKTTFTCG